MGGIAIGHRSCRVMSINRHKRTPQLHLQLLTYQRVHQMLKAVLTFGCSIMSTHTVPLQNSLFPQLPWSAVSLVSEIRKSRKPVWAHKHFEPVAMILCGTNGSKTTDSWNHLNQSTALVEQGYDHGFHPSVPIHSLPLWCFTSSSSQWNKQTLPCPRLPCFFPVVFREWSTSQWIIDGDATPGGAAPCLINTASPAWKLQLDN